MTRLRNINFSLHSELLLYLTVYSHQVVAKGWHHISLNWHLLSECWPDQFTSCTGNMWLPCSIPTSTLILRASLSTLLTGAGAPGLKNRPLDQHPICVAVLLVICAPSRREVENLILLPTTQTR